VPLIIIYEIWLTNVCPDEAPSAAPYHAPMSVMSLAELSIPSQYCWLYFSIAQYNSVYLLSIFL